MQTTSVFRMADAPKYEHLGARIRAARSALAERLGRDVTQAEVAEQLHVEPNHYSRIERGRVNPPRKGKETLSKFFGHFVNEPPQGTVVTHADRYPSRATERSGGPRIVLLGGTARLLGGCAQGRYVL